VNVVIRTLAALAVISASVPVIAATETKPAAALSPTAAWWEKVTVTIAGDGNAQSCKYETSLMPAATKDCDVVGDAKALSESAPAAKDQFTRLTFERRFNPGAAQPRDGALETGDTLLGRQVMALAIDGAGKVKDCHVVARSGAMTPSYGCSDAASEHFEASAAHASGLSLPGYMTILVYGHEEHVV
jgi:hypothetical protein